MSIHLGILASTYVARYTITFNTNGGDTLSPLTKQTHIPILPITYRAGYDFDGWYRNSGLTTPAVVGTKLTNNITVYARWVEQKEDLETIWEGEEPEVVFQGFELHEVYYDEATYPYKSSKIVLELDIDDPPSGNYVNLTCLSSGDNVFRGTMEIYGQEFSIDMTIISHAKLIFFDSIMIGEGIQIGVYLKSIKVGKV